MTPLAHGVGTRADLPLPVSYVVIGGGLAVLASFAVLALFWRTPKLRGGRAGRPLPARLAAILDHAVLTVALRGVALAVALLVLAVAFLGSPEVPLNLAPWVLFVTFWVGLVPLSIVFGPVWGRVNPLRTVCLGIEKLAGRPRGEHLLPRLGYWPAAVSLFAFAWWELAAPDRADPRRVGVFLAVYALVHLGAGAAFGQKWFAQGEGFEVYARLLGRLSPLGRRTDGTLVWRNPLDGAAAQPARRGLAAVLVVLIGSTAFDGLTRTRWWQDGPGLDAESQPLTALTGLLVMITAVALLYTGATVLGGALGRHRDAVNGYAHSLIPIAAGYAIAHYFSLLLFDGQTTYILVSDPFDTGLDLFGTANAGVDYTLVSPRVIALIQAGSIVIGHILGTVLAHDRAVARDDHADRSPHPALAQIPLLTVMIAFTIGGLTLLLGS